MANEGPIPVGVVNIIDYIKKHWKSFLAMTIIAVVSYFLWKHFQGKNEVLMEIFKAVFLASIIGFFIEGSSLPDSIRERLDTLADKQEQSGSLPQDIKDRLDSLNAKQDQCMEKQKCCGFLLPGIEFAQIVNLYFPRTKLDPIEHIKELISKTTDTLWVKQVSLFQLSNRKNGRMYHAFADRYLDIADIRLLLIDPASDQAKMRAYREYLLDIKSVSKPLSYKEFCRKKEWKVGPLFRDTNQSIVDFNTMRDNYYLKHSGKVPVAAVSAGETMSGAATQPFNFEIRKFITAPDASIMITDDAILFEPLHFGSLEEAVKQYGEDVPILSGKMPMFEFSRRDKPGIYDLMKDNFKFVYDHFSEPATEPAVNDDD